MKTIEVEDDVYAYLLNNTVRFGESPSEVLRRLLKLLPYKKTQGENKPLIAPSYTTSELSECVNGPDFLAQSNVVRKFLHILSCVYRRNPEEFSKVLVIKGRHRKYFGKSSEELDQSGNKVMPQRIPDSPYWVATNNDTPKKRRMLTDVLKVLGYDSDAIAQVGKALV